MLRDKKQELLIEKSETEAVKTRIAELQSFLDTSSQELTEYDEAMVRKYIDRIIVYEDKFTVAFKAGVKLDVNR